MGNISYAGDSAKSKPSFVSKKENSSQERRKGAKVSCREKFLCTFSAGHCGCYTPSLMAEWVLKVQGNPFTLDSSIILIFLSPLEEIILS